MYFNPRSLLQLALTTAFVLEASALDLEAWETNHPPDSGSGQAAKRAPIPLKMKPIGRPDHVNRRAGTEQAQPAIELQAISDPAVLLKGASKKREVSGDAAFDPTKHSTFFWGGYAGDNIYVANFTMSAVTDNEFILPVENFAKRMKSINCGTPGKPMVLEFSDKGSLSYAKSAWKWIDEAAVNHFVLVTGPDMCYKGDNRSPYLVSSIKFDDAKLSAEIIAEEKPWEEIAQDFTLNLGHEYVNPATASATHPHLTRRQDEGKPMDISRTFSRSLFNYTKDSRETSGLSLSANVDLTTGGSIIADFEIIKSSLLNIPKDAKLTIHPQGLNAIMALRLGADGRLGKAFQWDMKPQIEIPVQALKIKGILEIGPFITMGVHVETSDLAGTASLSVGAKATIKDNAKIDVRLGKPEENSISGWQPEFQKVDPTFSAEISGGVRAWNELGVQLKVEVLGKWGYQAGIDAQLPFIQATMSGIVDTKGVCGSQKTVGININTEAGINVNLNAGKVNEAPTFEKDLFEQSWPLYSTCIAIGSNNAKPDGAVPLPVKPEQPRGVGDMPLFTAPSRPHFGAVTGTGASSGFWPRPTGNTTFLRMPHRRPTAIVV